jgi:hypothetical protein
MKKRKKRTGIPRSAVFIVLLIISTASAQYELTWSTIDGGGGRSSGGPYSLLVTIGQPEAGASSGGQYELLGGFLPGGPWCFVDFEHYARFAQYWLEPGAGLPADLDQLNGVDGVDLKLFVEQWLCYCPVGWPLK